MYHSYKQKKLTLVCSVQVFGYKQEWDAKCHKITCANWHKIFIALSLTAISVGVLPVWDDSIPVKQGSVC